MRKNKANAVKSEAGLDNFLANPVIIEGIGDEFPDIKDIGDAPEPMTNDPSTRYDCKKSQARRPLAQMGERRR